MLETVEIVVLGFNWLEWKLISANYFNVDQLVEQVANDGIVTALCYILIQQTAIQVFKTTSIKDTTAILYYLKCMNFLALFKNPGVMTAQQ